MSRLFLDHQSTTPCDPAVVAAMSDYWQKEFANPHSADHADGWQAAAAVEKARGQIAALVGAKPREMIFTSGATEANNLAIKGVAYARRASGRTRLIAPESEHKCILSSLNRLRTEGFSITLLPVERDGSLSLNRLEDALDDKVALVSVMAANNEIGVCAPLAKISALVHSCGAWFHSDAAQAFGKIPLDVNLMSIDLMSLSGHKIYGPKGIGALYMRSRGPKVTVQPLIDGGGQERGMRAGTLPVPLCVGFGTAALRAQTEMAKDFKHLYQLSRRFLTSLEQADIRFALNGPPLSSDALSEDHSGDNPPRLPGNINVTFPNVDSAALLAKIPDLSVSTGSACSSAGTTASHVLKAIGHDPRAVDASLRIGFGRFTQESEVDQAAAMIVRALKSLV